MAVARPAAVAPIRHLAWEPLYATSVALKSQKKKKTQNKKTNQQYLCLYHEQKLTIFVSYYDYYYTLKYCLHISLPQKYEVIKSITRF